MRVLLIGLLGGACAFEVAVIQQPVDTRQREPVGGVAEQPGRDRAPPRLRHDVQAADSGPAGLACDAPFEPFMAQYHAGGEAMPASRILGALRVNIYLPPGTVITST